ncbi:MAG: hypothetical protein JST06_04910 [Bacteroidetes bacterium]|nr:hypothetical protein [Bacteroidota bacterium]MBS1630803.1 hypothetical protein [Bacteroidota bacterium]
MIARFLHILCSLWLAALLLFGTTPAAAIHAFAHHHDTLHHHSQERFSIDPKHHHCQFLSFHLMPFEAPPQWVPLPAPQRQIPKGFIILQDERATQQNIALREGRGPPDNS